MTRRRWLVISICAIATLLAVGRVAASLYVDFRWYESLNAADVWWARVANLAILRGSAFVVSTAIVFANLFAVRHSVLSVVFPRRVGNIEIREEVSGRLLLGIVLGISVALGGLLAAPFDEWTTVELVRHGALFRESDPYFQMDIAFWLYWLPLEVAVQMWLLLVVAVATIVVVVLYALTPSLRWEAGRLRLTSYVRRHFFCLASVFLLLLAWSYRLDAYNLLLDGGGRGGALTALAHRFEMPANLVLAMFTVVCAVLLCWAGWFGQLRVGVVTFVAVFFVAIGVRQIAPPIVQRFLTPMDAEQQERAYQATRASFSRRAFDVARIRDADTTGARSQDAALAGIPLWDQRMTERALAATTVRGRFTSPVGWRATETGLEVVGLIRPVGPDAAAADAPWGTEVFHANGAAQTDTRDASERLAGPVLIADSARGYMWFSDSTSRVTSVLLDRLGVRLAHAWALQNSQLLTKRAGGRILLHRNLRDRLQRLFPAFALDRSTTPLIVRDTVFWATHLYAVSTYFPLSEPIEAPQGALRYMRHAAVAVVNARTGRVFAIADPDPDPTAASWMRRFPRLFVSVDNVSEAILRAIPAPIDLAVTQAQVFARYGRRGEVSTFSQLPRVHGGDSSFVAPFYTPTADIVSARLAWTTPIVDASDRVRGAYVAHGGAAFRPEWYPIEPNGSRWASVVERFRRLSDSASAARRDGAIIRGPVRVVPLGSGLTFVQTSYFVREGAPPSIERVATLTRDSLQSGRSVRAALGLPEPIPPELPLDPAAFRERVSKLHTEMREALARGDFTRFGTAFEALGRAIRLARTP